MTDRTQRSRSAAGSSRLQAALARQGWWRFVGVFVILLLACGAGTFVFFRNLASGDLVAARELIDQLRSESQVLRRQTIDQAAELTATKAKLTAVQAKLDAIMPSQNVYNLHPNQTLIVADNHLTIGLVGAPANESVALDINGKQQTAIAGQPISVVPDSSTSCTVVVQSFDMFKAVVTASCVPKKPQ